MLIVLLFVWQLSLARAEQDTHAIIIKDHKFAPAQLTIPSKTKVKIFIENQDSTPEEFESFELNREKVVAANGKVVIFIGPLRPGVYRFFGEFHKNTAQGQIVVQ
ncbi:MAG: cupredoxin domain-containing protein [Candidatus Omnitrophota bacterium]